MSEIKWIKITTNIFNDEKITLIEQLPESDTIIVIWFKLLVMAGVKNDCGLVYITKELPYNPEKLSAVMKRPVNVIRLALKTFVEFQMIEIHNDLIAITNWEKHQNVDGMERLKLQWKEASKKYREKQKTKLIEVNHKTSYDDHNTEKIREDKNRKDKEADSDKTLYMDNVLLSDKEHTTLISKYGIEQTNAIIEKLNYWKISNGKDYVSDYGAINSWVAKAVKAVKLEDKVKVDMHGTKQVSQEEWERMLQDGTIS